MREYRIQCEADPMPAGQQPIGSAHTPNPVTSSPPRPTRRMSVGLQRNRQQPTVFDCCQIAFDGIGHRIAHAALGVRCCPGNPVSGSSDCSVGWASRVGSRAWTAHRTENSSKRRKAFSTLIRSVGASSEMWRQYSLQQQATVLRRLHRHGVGDRLLCRAQRHRGHGDSW